jgi:hypothetical protein
MGRCGLGAVTAGADVWRKIAHEIPLLDLNWTGRPLFEMINVIFKAFSDCAVGFGLPSFLAKKIMEDR